MRIRLQWSHRAQRDIQEIYAYIASDNGAAAQRWADELHERTQHLREFPRMGRAILAGHKNVFREVIVGNYRVVYLLKHDAAVVLTVMHARQKPLFSSD